MRRAICLLTTAAVAACAVDPGIQPPQVPATEQYTPTPVAPQTASASVPGGHAQRFAPGQDVPAQWWTLFRSPSLDSLVRQALEGSPTLARVRARLSQAQEDLSARSGANFPSVDAKLSANRVDVHPQSLGVQSLPIQTPFNLYLASVGVSYSFDLFGSTRRELEALRFEVDHQRFGLEAARMMLAGNVGTAAIREASLREQLATTGEIVALQTRQLAIAERLERLGTVAQADVVAARRDLAQTRAALPELQRELVGDGAVNVVGLIGRGATQAFVDAALDGPAGPDWPRAWRIFRAEAWLDDLDELRVHLGGGEARVILYGVSGGAYLAHQYLARHGEHVLRAYTAAAVHPFLVGELGLATDRFWEELGERDPEDQARLARALEAHPDERFTIAMLLQNTYEAALRTTGGC